MREKQELNKELFDKIQGCIHGFAIGDALGYLVEFDSINQIKQKYGSRGVYKYPHDSDGNSVGLYSDDTQMSLAVAKGLLDSKPPYDVEEVMQNITKRFIEWKETQKDLTQKRAPGTTCLGGIENLERGVPWRQSGLPSYSCGSAMRVAPIGIMFYNNPKKLKEIAEAQAISTHNHPISVASAIAASYLVSKSIDGKDPRDIGDLVEFTSGINSDFTEKIGQVNDVRNLPPQKALDIIGPGWRGHEAVAAALYCIVKNDLDYEKTVLMAANTNGDSDSIACIAGGIVGAYVGMDKIPLRLQRGLENRELLRKTGRELYKKLGGNL